VSALTPLHADAPPEEWGAFAVSIPGWRWPDGMHCLNSSPHPPDPDPDHWAWEGWMLRLLGRGPWDCGYHVAHGYYVEHRGSRAGTTHHRSLGRACIAAAAALGRWPGGSDG